VNLQRISIRQPSEDRQKRLDGSSSNCVCYGSRSPQGADLAGTLPDVWRTIVYHVRLTTAAYGLPRRGAAEPLIANRGHWFWELVSIAPLPQAATREVFPLFLAEADLCFIECFRPHWRADEDLERIPDRTRAAFIASLQTSGNQREFTSKLLPVGTHLTMRHLPVSSFPLPSFLLFSRPISKWSSALERRLTVTSSFARIDQAAS